MGNEVVFSPNYLLLGENSQGFSAENVIFFGVSVWVIGMELSLSLRLFGVNALTERSTYQVLMITDGNGMIDHNCGCHFGQHLRM